MTYHFIVTGYNCQDYIEKCLDSIFEQKIPRDVSICVSCYFDGSDGIVYEKVRRFGGGINLWSSIKGENRGAAYSRNLLIELCEPKLNDVIITIDGDDYLAHDRVLERIHQEYMKGADVTYGNLATADNQTRPIIQHGFSDEQLKEKNFRSYGWRSSQIRTLKAKLYMNLHEDNFKDKEGNWLRNCTDLALMFPILEQAENPVFIPDILYIYNNNTGINTLDRFGRINKRAINKYVRSMKTKFK